METDLEDRFLALLDSLRLKPSFVRLFHETVVDVWKQEFNPRASLRSRLEHRIAEQNARLTQLDEAFIYRSAVDQETYETQRDRLREQRTLAELELNETQNEALDVEGLVAFAENVLINAGSCGPQRLRLEKRKFKRPFPGRVAL